MIYYFVYANYIYILQTTCQAYLFNFTQQNEQILKYKQKFSLKFNQTTLKMNNN